MRKIIALIALLCATFAVKADIPDRPNPPRLVNDFAHLLSEAQLTMLEDSLVRFDKRTSTQVTVVTINSLDGYDIADYAYRIGQQWGVGQKGKNNGIIILVKPKDKDGTKGHAFIAPGYGLEGSLPDITCSRIVRDDMIPHFKRNDYAAGIIAGARAVMKRCEGEYTNERQSDSDSDGASALLILIIVIIVIIALSGKGGGRSGGGNGWTSAAILFDVLSSSHRSNTGWGSFNSGGGSFGGFGGGSFGGGGGGGSW